MKNAFSLFVLCIFFAACSSDSSPEKKTSSNDNGLTSIKSDRENNLLDKLYEELKEQRPELQKLEDEILEIDQKKENALAEYKSYHAKNEQGYLIAHQYMANIQDSLLRNNIELLINKSQYAYEQQNAAMALANATLESRSTALHDHQQALKIILALSLMEKYQKKLELNPSEYETIITRYNTTIHQADSLLQAK